MPSGEVSVRRPLPPTKAATRFDAGPPPMASTAGLVAARAPGRPTAVIVWPMATRVRVAVEDGARGSDPDALPAARTAQPAGTAASRHRIIEALIVRLPCSLNQTPPA